MALTRRLRPRAALGAGAALDRAAGDGGSAAGGSWWLFSNAKSELAPLEDRGVILATVNAPDGATLDYTARYLRRDRAHRPQLPGVRPRLHVRGRQPDGVAGRVASCAPSTGTSASAARRSWRASCCRSSWRLPGVTAFPITPPSLGQGFRERSINFVIVSQRQLREPGARVAAVPGRDGQEPRHRAARQRPAAEQARDLHRGRPRPRRRHGRQRRRGGAHGGDHARRPRRDALQARRRAVRRDGADRRPRPHHARRHREALRARPRRRDGAAVARWSRCARRSARAS